MVVERRRETQKGLIRQIARESGYNNNNKNEFKPKMVSTILGLPHLTEVQLRFTNGS